MVPIVPSLQTHLPSLHVLREVPAHEGPQVKHREGSRGEGDVGLLVGKYDNVTIERRTAEEGWEGVDDGSWGSSRGVGGATTGSKDRTFILKL